MATDTDSENKISELRRRAESALLEKAGDASDTSALSPEDVQKLVHELQVHQDELEMQNEELRRTRQELEATRDKYVELYDTAPLGYFVLDQKGVILEANLTGSAIFGTARGFLTGKPIASFVNEEDGDALYLHLRQVLETQSRQSCDVRLTKKDGSQVPVRLESLTLRGQDGSPSVFRTLVIDVTKRKHAEEALFASESRYRRLFEGGRDGILIVDFDTGKILDVNEYLIDMLGYSHEEFLDKCLWEVSPFKDTALNKDAFAELLEKGYIRYEDLPLETSDGRSIAVEVVSNSNLVCGVTFIQCNIRDITERKRTEEALKESDRKYHTLFEDSIDGVYSVLWDGTITHANSSFCELFGYTSKEMIGKDVVELYLDPADRPKFQEEMEKKGFLKDYELKMRKKDGTEVDSLLTSSVDFGEDGSITGYRSILRDLTESKKLHSQLLQAQKMEAVGALAGGIAHDFNNVLQVVLGYSELVVAEEDMPDLLRNDLGRVILAARNGADLVQKLLTFSRKSEAKPLILDLNQRIRQTHKFLERTIPKMIDIELILADDLARVHADPTQMDQVLMNLAVNARDAMPEGGNLIFETKNVVLDEDYAKLHLEAKPGRYVLLSVSDTGSGMDKETLEHIFEPFYTTKALGQGTGLGLAMVFGIVRQHHGFIKCYSEVGHGTTFKIYLPAIISLTRSDLPIITSTPQGGTETILLVDDEELIRDLGKRILSKVGYTILTASNGEEALDLYRSNKGNISLVMLDLIMPGMGGKPCLEELLKIDPDVKILVASGYSADGPTKDALSIGAKGFVVKPFDVRQVLEMVRKTIDEE